MKSIETSNILDVYLKYKINKHDEFILEFGKWEKD